MLSSRLGTSLPPHMNERPLETESLLNDRMGVYEGTVKLFLDNAQVLTL